MKLYYVIYNSLKRKLKDYKSLGIMIVFPILLTFIFITVFGSMDMSFKIDQQEKQVIKAAIYSQGDEAFNESLGTYLGEISKGGQINLTYQFASSKEAAIKDLDNQRHDVVALVSEEGSITLYGGKNKQNKVEVFKGIVKTFLENTALNKVVKDNNLQITKQDKQTVKLYNVKSREPSSKNFFVLSIAATMISFAVLMAGSYGSSQVYYIRKAVGKRVQSSPLSKNTIYFGEYISGVIMAFIQGGMITLICDLFFDIGFKNNPLQMIGLLVLLSMMSVSLGICIGALIPNEKVSGGIVSIVLMILCFTSGGFNPNMDLGKIATYSPITVINKAIVDICMNQTAQNFAQTVLITLSLTALCLVIAVISINIKTREAN